MREGSLLDIMRAQSYVVAACMLIFSAEYATPASAAGPPETDPRILVVTDGASTEVTHAKALTSLRDRGFELDIRVAKDSSAADLALSPPGAAPTEYRYGGILLLCPTAAGMQKKLPVSTVERFIERGGNVYFVAGASYSNYIQSIANKIGVEIDDASSRVIDHQNVFKPLDQGDRTHITAGGRTDSKYLLGSAADSLSGDIFFHGPGASVFSDNELVSPVIWGSGSSYSYTPGSAVTKGPFESGSATVLAATLPTRVGSRVTYFGSYDVLADSVLEMGEAHATAMTSLLAWTFGHSGVLRTKNLRYSTEREGAEENGFRVKDDIVFAIDIQAWDGDAGGWGEYVAEDIQVELVMLNPWVRTRLAHVGNGDNSTYTALVPVPDQIGIYKFVISYHRVGVTGLELSHVLPIRPFLHNEYKRFIPMAYPYYAACFTMLLSVFLLGVALNFGSTSPFSMDVSEDSSNVASPSGDASAASKLGTAAPAAKGTNKSKGRSRKRD